MNNKPFAKKRIIVVLLIAFAVIILGLVVITRGGMILSSHDNSDNVENTTLDKSNQCDTIYSLYYYYHESIQKLLAMPWRSAEFVGREIELADKMHDANWAASALLTYLDEWKSDLPMDCAFIEERVYSINSHINEILSEYQLPKETNNDDDDGYYYWNYAQGILDQGIDSLRASCEYIIVSSFEYLDKYVFDDYSSQNLISREDLIAKCKCEITNYISCEITNYVSVED